MEKKKMRYIECLFIIIALICMSSGCIVDDMIGDAQGTLFEKVKFDDDSNYTAVAAEQAVDCEYYKSNGEITHGYDSLNTDKQKECYKAINEAVYKISEEANENNMYPIGKVTVNDGSFSELDMDVCIKAYLMDNPQVFWITNRYNYGSAGNQAIIQLFSYVSGTECQKMIGALNEEINKIMTSIPNNLKEYHLEKYIHNEVLEKCTYAKGINTAEDGWEEFTVYGALIDGSAVCEGYAHAMCMLLNKVGIDCYYANGYGENSPHMWNTVKIDGNWYHLDATWDDHDNAYFNYFNLNDKQIQSDHIISEKYEDKKSDESLGEVYNLFLPECNSDSANYFVVESTYIYDFEESREIMVEDLVNAAKNLDDIFTVKIDNSIDFQDAMDEMFNEDPYYMFDYIKEANEQLESGHKINDKNASIIMLENFNSVVVKLEYN